MGHVKAVHTTTDVPLWSPSPILHLKLIVPVTRFVWSVTKITNLKLLYNIKLSLHSFSESEENNF